GEVVPVGHDAPVLGADEPEEHGEDGRLAGPARPGERDGLAGMDGQGGAVEGGGVASLVGDGHAVQAERGVREVRDVRAGARRGRARVKQWRPGGAGPSGAAVTRSRRSGACARSGTSVRVPAAGAGVSPTSKIRAAAVTRSTLAWYCAPTARSGRSASGARISTSSAVSSAISPSTRRSPIDTATSATDSDDSRSRPSADRKA